jgi:hypothetical protein
MYHSIKEMFVRTLTTLADLQVIPEDRVYPY